MTLRFPLIPTHFFRVLNRRWSAATSTGFEVHASSNASRYSNHLLTYDIQSRNLTRTNVSCGADTISCWKCGVVIDLNGKVLFCDHCDVVQKPHENADYFEILGLKRSFDLDVKELAKRFRLLQMQLHPDHFVHKSQDEKRISAGYSSLLNQAYKVLQLPLERGIYLLELETGAGLRETEDPVEPEFLAEIMDVNEKLDEVENQHEIQTLSAENRATMDLLFRKVAKCFHAKDWKEARNCLLRLKYYANIDNKLKELIHSKEEGGN